MIVEAQFDPQLAPERAHETDAGLDLKSTERIVLNPGCHSLVPTGVRLALPVGYVGMVCPRSGLAAKHSVTVLNAPGIVDSGYRGEIFVNLYNAGGRKHTIMPGDRVAQLVVQRHEHITLEPVDVLPEAERGEAGHGSTGA